MKVLAGFFCFPKKERGPKMVKTKTATKKTKTKNGRPPLGTEDFFYKYGGKPHLGTYGWREYYAKQPLTFGIRQEDIDNGIPGATPTCIVALAVSNLLSDRYVVEVQNTIVRVIDESQKKRLTFTIPGALRSRLRVFDKLHFWDLPPALYRLDAHKATRTSASRKAGKKQGNQPVTVVNNQHVRRKPKKARNHPTRVISRGRIVRWANETPMLKTSGKKRKTRAA